MKRLLPILIIGLAASGCAALSPEAEPLPTYTLLPTYTAFPTWTPAPTATATFLPSPTAEQAASPTPESVAEAATPTTAATATPDATQVTTAFGSNLRDGPGTDFDILTRVEGNTPLTVLGRNESGLWLEVQTLGGTIGWIAVRQLQGPIDVALIPLSDLVPTPQFTRTPTSTPGPGTPTATAQATVTGTPPTATPATGTPGTAVPTQVVDDERGLAYILNPGEDTVCRNIVAGTEVRFPVSSSAEEFVPFDSANAAEIVEERAYQFLRNNVPDFIQVFVQGTVGVGSCDAENTCDELTLTLCALASPGAPTGGSEYVRTVTLQVGTQSYDSFFVDAAADIDLVLSVVEP
ncbi:MAG: SH3 domain-containing protein [Chloroflexi bacterium]|nr:SH3 domain-containing protein [Chloroflexota bacterium]